MKVFNRVLSAYFIAALASAPAVTAPIDSGGTFSSVMPHTAEQRTGRDTHADLAEFLLRAVLDPGQFDGKRIAIVVSENASAFELEVTRDYFFERGARVDILFPRTSGRATAIDLAARLRLRVYTGRANSDE